jgi:hypothetical protein
MWTRSKPVNDRERVLAMVVIIAVCASAIGIALLGLLGVTVANLIQQGF